MDKLRSFPVGIDKYRGFRTPGQGLNPHGTGSGEEVEHSRVGHSVPENGETAFAHGIGGRSQLLAPGRSVEST